MCLYVSRHLDTGGFVLNQSHMFTHRTYNLHIAKLSFIWNSLVCQSTLTRRTDRSDNYFNSMHFINKIFEFEVLRRCCCCCCCCYLLLTVNRFECEGNTKDQIQNMEKISCKNTHNNRNSNAGMHNTYNHTCISSKQLATEWFVYYSIRNNVFLLKSNTNSIKSNEHGMK